MYFYKYQKPGNLELNMLRRGEIFFASVGELNDASECRPRFVLNGTKELWTRLAQFILEEVCLRLDTHERMNRDEIRKLLGLSSSLGSLLKKHVRNLDFGLENLDALFRQVLADALQDNVSALRSQLILDSSREIIRREIPRLLREPTYITSFSKNAKNPTMWGHYADAERGFVIVYSTDDRTIGVCSPIKMLHGTRPLGEDQIGDYEIGIYDEDRLELKTVKYGRKPPKANAFHRLIPRFSYTEAEDHYDVPLLLGGDAKDKEENQVGLIKYSDWKYEQEIRAFLPAYGTLPPDVRVLRVSLENIRGIIFGPQMSNQDKDRVILCCHLMRESSAIPDGQSLPEFAFFQASQLLDRFDFQISPVGVLDGLYFGDGLPIKLMKDVDETTARALRKMSEEIENGLQESSVETNRVCQE